MSLYLKTYESRISLSGELFASLKNVLMYEIREINKVREER